MVNYLLLAMEIRKRQKEIKGKGIITRYEGTFSKDTKEINENEINSMLGKMKNMHEKGKRSKKEKKRKRN